MTTTTTKTTTNLEPFYTELLGNIVEEMTLNGSGVRDIARRLQLSTSTVIRE